MCPCASAGTVVPKILPGLSLSDAAFPECTQAQWKEGSGKDSGQSDQQKLLEKVIRAIHKVVNHDQVYLVATNSPATQLEHPSHRPDLTSFAEEAVYPAWSQVGARTS